MGRRKKDDYNKFDHIKYLAAWQKTHTKSYAFRFNCNTDADIIEILDNVENKSAYVKKLIRNDNK